MEELELGMSRADALIYRFGPGYLIKIIPNKTECLGLAILRILIESQSLQNRFRFGSRLGDKSSPESSFVASRFAAKHAPQNASIKTISKASVC